MHKYLFTFKGRKGKEFLLGQGLFLMENYHQSLKSCLYEPMFIHLLIYMIMNTRFSLYLWHRSKRSCKTCKSQQYRSLTVHSSFFVLPPSTDFSWSSVINRKVTYTIFFFLFLPLATCMNNLNFACFFLNTMTLQRKLTSIMREMWIIAIHTIFQQKNLFYVENKWCFGIQIAFYPI